MTSAAAQTLRQESFFNLEALRQCHALEHGTVWVLSEQQPRMSLGGTSTAKGFYIYGPVETSDLEQAAHEALARFKKGAPDLAVHPRCGTNISVGMLLTMGLSVGINRILPARPFAQILGVGLAIYGASLFASSLGALAQRHVTTAIPLDLEILSVKKQKDWLGRPSHFVAVQWTRS